MSYNLKLAGSVRPPADMIQAARASLTPRAFDDLMNQTGGAAPTPAQLCAAVNIDRAQMRSAGLGASLGELSMSAEGLHAAA